MTSAENPPTAEARSGGLGVARPRSSLVDAVRVPLLDAFVAPSLLGTVELRRRARLIAAFALFTVAFLPVFFVLNLRAGQIYEALAIAGAAGGSLSAVAVLRLRGRLALASSIHLGTYLVMIPALTLQNGLSYDSGMWFLVLLPPIALVLIGARAGLIMGALIAGIYLGYGAFTAGAELVLEEIPELVAAQLVLLAFVYWMMAMFEKAKNQALAELDSANAKLAEEVEERRRAEERLTELHGALVQSARAAGMADIATGVLHNVGNVLNSVGTSASIIEEKLGRSRKERLEQVASLVKSHEGDLARFFGEGGKGRQLPAYLEKLADHIRREREELSGEARALTESVDHIKRIIATQQTYASARALSEEVDLAELIGDALKLDGASLERHGVTVERELNEVPKIEVDRHRLLQILVNLLANAKDAVGNEPPERRRIRVGLLCPTSDRVRIAVEDWGVGMDEDTRARLFRYGFTTKPHGHGFGLHAAATAAQELGGSLEAESEGPGRGARFVLELPLGSEAQAPANDSGAQLH